MADAPRSTVEAKDFSGLVTNADPADIPVGAAEDQVNCASMTLGELQVRLGYRQVTFDT
jgi:hypothetical protein